MYKKIIKPRQIISFVLVLIYLIHTVLLECKIKFRETFEIPSTAKLNSAKISSLKVSLWNLALILRETLFSINLSYVVRMMHKRMLLKTKELLFQEYSV